MERVGNMKEYGKVAAVLGISMVMASLVFGVFFFESRRPQQTITVVGIASKQYGYRQIVDDNYGNGRFGRFGRWETPTL